MGIKFLNFHTIPWCLHLISNRISCFHLPPEQSPPVTGTIKLIKSDGVVKIYDKPISVSDIMFQFPKHLVCSSDSFYIGQKIPALPEHDELQIGGKYFLLPQHFFQTVLSFVTVASFAAASAESPSRNAFLKKAATCRPFDIQKSPSGGLRIRVSDEFIAQLMEEGRVGETAGEEQSGGGGDRVCTTAQLKKDYSRLVGSPPRRRWEPKLETIKEAEKKRRIVGATTSFRRKCSRSSPVGLKVTKARK